MTTTHSHPAAYKVAAHHGTYLPHVFSGLFFIVAGTLGAALTVPEDVGSATALVAPAIFMTVGLLIPVMLRMQRDVTKILRVEHVLVVGVIYWLLLDLVQSAYPYYDVDQSSVTRAFIAMGIFSAAVWLGAAGRGWRLPTVIRVASERSLSAHTIFLAITISFALGVADFVSASDFDPVTLVDGVLAPRFGAPWSRGEFGGADAFLNFLQYFGYALPALCVLLARRAGWMRPRTLFGIALTAIMLLLLAQSGGRRIIGVSVGSALITWLVGEPKLRPRTCFLAASVVAMLLAFLNVMLLYRDSGFIALLSRDGFEGDYSDRLYVDDNFLRLSQVIMIFPSTHAYVFLKPLYHAVTLPIPRIFWPGKPIDVGFDLAQLVGEKGASLSCSIIGELYASFGFSAVFVGGLVMGRLAGMWNKCLEAHGRNGATLMYGTGVMAMFAGLRSLQALVEMSYMVIAWLAISAMLGERGRGGSA